MTLVMGVLNLTPDSFSDGGAYPTDDAAVAHAARLVDEGADIIDVGGESTRPGAWPVGPTEEQDRILSVVRRLAARGVAVSVDTTHAATALAAVERGASLVNDVSGGLGDPRMYEALASLRTPYILGHWRGTPRSMDEFTKYPSPVGDVKRELGERIANARSAGLWDSQIILDPGLGFAKEPQQNWELLAHLPAFKSVGFPVMIGASRKRFLAELLPASASTDDRDLPTAVVSVLAAQQGVWAVRVHDVASTRIALNALSAWCAAETSVPELAPAP
jgi:dihydropteroate synthase